MADPHEQDFNRSGLTVQCNRVWYTGQKAEKVPPGLIGIAGSNCLSLDLSYNELSSLLAVKDFVNLEELILDNNSLRDLNSLPKLPKLKTLSLNNNKFSDLDVVLEKIAQCCPTIQYVSLLGNPGCPDQLTNPVVNDEADYERYRLYAIHALKTLRFLDSRVITSRERLDAERRGRFLKTVKFGLKSNVATTPIFDEFDDGFFNVNYTPLPQSSRNPHDHTGAFGKCKYRYSGKNSEGNRFIMNKDL